MRTRRAALLALTLTATFDRSAKAGGPDGASCGHSYEEAQQLRIDGKLLDARAKLLVCAQASCPAFIKTDCAKWLAEIEGSLPNVLFTAKGPDGAELVDVEVRVDGNLATSRLTGRAIPIDPGEHRIVFLHDGAKEEVRVVLHEGDPRRTVAVSFSQRAETARVTPGPSVVLPPQTDAPRVHRPVPVSVYVLFGAGVLGGIGFATLAGIGRSGESDLEACKGRCSDRSVDAVKRNYLFADLSLALGVAASGIATVLFVTRPEKPMVIQPAIGLDGKGATVGARWTF